MKLIVGLGNPGKKYEHTRHNVGFIAIDKIAGSFNFEPFAFDKKFNALLSFGNINGEKVLLLKPQTFMNSSGASVRSAMDYYKISSNDLLVIQDELDVAMGEYKTTKDRSSAGHKGIQSIIDALGTKDFIRYRIGMESDRGNMASEDFVLANFTADESDIINGITDRICDNIKERI